MSATDATEAQLGAGARHGRRSLRHGIGLFTLLADEYQFLGVLHGHACCIVDAGKADGVQHAVVADGNGLTFALKVAVDVDDVGEADACVMKLVDLGGVEHAVDTHTGNIALEDKLSCVSKLFFECLPTPRRRFGHFHLKQGRGEDVFSLSFFYLRTGEIPRFHPSGTPCQRVRFNATS